MMDALYNQLIKAVIKQNKMIEEQTRIPQDCRRQYNSTNIPFEERILKIRWIKIPTVIRENKIWYYAVFLVDVSFWRKGELKKIYRQVIESIDAQDVDTHTIFLAGKLYGFFDKMNNQPKYYHIFRINTDKLTVKERQQILDCICNYLQKRIDGMIEQQVKIPAMKQDILRLQFFVDTFRNIRVIAMPARYVSNTSHGHTVIESMTNTKTSHSYITRVRGDE
jgi:hypothetical protein